MTGKEDPTSSAESSGATRPAASGGKAARYGVPVAVLTVVVASIGLVPALADNGDPDLPEITAEELVAKIADSEVEQFSGTVKTRTDLGLPGGSLRGMLPDGDPAAGEGSAADVDPSSRFASLFSGEHTVKLAVDGEDRQRVAIDGGRGEYLYLHDGDTVWGYDSAAKTAFKGKAPQGAEEHGKPGPSSADPREVATELLDALEDTTSISVDGTTRVADRDAYQLAVTPKDAPDSTVDALRIAVDAEHGVPLRVSLDAKGSDRPVGEVAFQKVDFDKPASSVFDFTPPKGTKILNEDELAKHRPGAADGLPGLEGVPGLDGFPGLTELKDGKSTREGGAGKDVNVEVVGKGWDSVLVVRAPEQAKGDGKADERGRSGALSGLLDSYTDPVKGEFGTGRVVSTHLVNALLTEDGSVYVGAVTKDGLVKVANAD